MKSDTALLRLCQLVSPALPVGTYNFSQGLEYAAHAQWVHDAADAGDWILGIARHSIGTLDVPVLLRLHSAWRQQSLTQVQYWSAFLVASRETSELRAEERHLGRSLAKVLVEWQLEAARDWIRHEHASYAALFALAAAHWQIDAGDAAQAYVWAWCENQVLAALKLLPMGQFAGQRLLNELLQQIPAIVAQAMELDDADIGIATPLHGMASAWHETQYTRLFRS